MAAFLIFSGVSKSGSPAPNPMISFPAAFNSRAFWVTAMVADGLILFILCDSSTTAYPQNLLFIQSAIILN